MAIDPVWILIIALIVFVGISAGILYYLEKTKDKRVSKVRQASSLDKDDEAYNKVKSTKSIINVMKRSGKNTSDAEVIIDRAELALQSGDYSKATSLAEKAKTKLEEKTAVQGTSSEGGHMENKDNNSKNNSKNRSGDLEMKEAYTLDDLESLETDEENEEVRAKSEELQKQKEKIQNLPENYLESKFEIEQASEMLEEEGGDAEAEELLERARIRFDEEKYTEALSLSLKCKKAIDEDKAGVIKFQKIGKSKTNEGQPGAQDDKGRIERKQTIIKKMEGAKEDLSEMEKEIREEGEQKETKMREDDLSEKRPRCPECEYVGEIGDNFCPKCGTEMLVQLTCPSCGNEVDDKANFCPRCGSEISLEIYECPECATEVKGDERFCPKCGIEFE